MEINQESCRKKAVCIFNASFSAIDHLWTKSPKKFIMVLGQSLSLTRIILCLRGLGPLQPGPFKAMWLDIWLARIRAFILQLSPIERGDIQRAMGYNGLFGLVGKSSSLVISLVLSIHTSFIIGAHESVKPFICKILDYLTVEGRLQFLWIKMSSGIPTSCVAKSSLVLYLLAITLPLSDGRLYQTAMSSRVVDTQYGKIRGVLIKLPDDHLPLVEAYLGLQYASVIGGDLRFMPPTSPMETWDGIRVALKFRPVCPQKIPREEDLLRDLPVGRVEHFKRIITFLERQAEECLNLNIYVPVRGE